MEVIECPHGAAWSWSSTDKNKNVWIYCVLCEKWANTSIDARQGVLFK